MNDQLDQWRVATPAPRDFSPGAISHELEARSRSRRQRAYVLLAIPCCMALLGTMLGMVRADATNHQALATLRNVHIASLGAEIEP